MAVSGKTSAPWEVPYFQGTDKPPDMAAVTKAIADRVHAILAGENQQALSWLKKGSKKQIVVCNSSGVPQYVTATGDVTNDEAGVFAIGKEKVNLEKLSKDLGLPESYLAPVVQAKLNDERVPLDGSATSRKMMPSLGTARMSEDTLSLTESFQDIPGAVLEITPAVASTLVVIATFELDGSSAGSDLQGAIKVDTEEERERRARVQGEARTVATLVDAISLTAAKHTIKIRAKRGATGTAVATKLGTQFLWALFAS